MKGRIKKREISKKGKKKGDKEKAKRKLGKKRFYMGVDKGE